MTPDLGQLRLERGRHRYRVDDGIDSHAREPLLLGQGDPELVEHRPQFGIDLIQAGRGRLGRRSRVVDDVLVVDGSVGEVRPAWLGQGAPVSIGPQPPFQQPVRFALLGRDQSDDVFVQSRGSGVGVDVGDKAVLILVACELTDISWHGCHQEPAVRARPMRTRQICGPASR